MIARVCRAASLLVVPLATLGVATDARRFESVVRTPATANSFTTSLPAVLTYHSDNLRTGWNPGESVLTQSTVASKSFGFLRRISTDGLVSAQPLYVPNVLVAGVGRHNILIIATEHDSVYAYDADNYALLWQRSFSVPSQHIGPEPTSDTPCKVIEPWIGISSTPAIDRVTKTIYVVAKTVQTGASTTYFLTLHKLSLTTGADRVPPVVIAGTFILSNGQTVTFSAQDTYDRAGILLSNGTVYVPISTMCDGNQQTSHGWAFAYSTQNLAPAGGFNTTLDTGGYEFRGSIWQSTYGISGDAAGNVYFATANGAFDAFPSGANYGDSVLRMSPTLTVADYFTPYNEAVMEKQDYDLGSGGVMLLPDQSGPDPHLAVAAGKSTAIYLLNRDDLGKFTPSGPDRVLQSIPFSGNGVWGGPAYFSDATGTFVYYTLYGGPIMALRLTTSPSPHLALSSQTRVLFGGTGTTPSVSSNGTKSGSAIVWAIRRPERGSGTPMELEAFNADDLAQRLFHASIGKWNNPVSWPFLTPTVAGGKAFAGSPGGVLVFGLR